MPLSPRLTIYRWRAPMIASIAHRASGLVLVLFVPFYLWVLHGMTGSPEDFEAAKTLLYSPLGRLMLWMAGTAFIYHFCNGIRFMMFDAGRGETHAMMRMSANLMIAITFVSALVLAGLLV